jgi:hypothetical protein
MPIPRKLLQQAFATLSDKTLRAAAEHLGIRGRASASKEELVKKLSGEDGFNMVAYSSYFTVPELKAIAGVFAIDPKGKKKDDLDRAISGFVENYDRITRKLTYDDVFANPKSSDFGSKLRDWMEARHSSTKLSNLSDGEKILWEIRYALMDINGNSFPGFFESGSDDRPAVVIRALGEIGAKKSAAALERIGKKLFDRETIPATTATRSEAFLFEDDDEAEAFDAKLDQCRAIWEKAGEDLAALSQRFAAKNSDRFR